MATKKLTAAEIDAMTLPALRTAAAKVFDPDDIQGLRKAQLIEQLKDFHGVDEVEDEEDDEDLDPPDDSMEDDDEEDDDVELEAEDDDELDDEVDEPETKSKPKAKPADKAKPEPAGDTFTAKQVATRIGTDAKTLRKFFRSANSTTEAVGQGGRYEFAKSDLPKIKAEFEKWNSTKAVRTPSDGPKKPRTRAEAAPASAVVEDEEELELVDDIEDDTELDDLELDDDDEIED